MANPPWLRTQCIYLILAALAWFTRPLWFAYGLSHGGNAVGYIAGSCLFMSLLTPILNEARGY